MPGIERDPVVPGALQKLQVARAVHTLQQLDTDLLRRVQRAQAAPAQLGQHMLDTVWHLHAGRQPAAEHLVAAVVPRMHRVDEDLHRA